MAIIHNGVTLPELPCPYECNIVLYAVSENTYVMISSSAPIVVAESVAMTFAENATISMYIWMDGQGLTDWMVDGEDVPVQGGTELFPVDAAEVIYSDYDILNAETGEIYFPSSVKPLFYYNGVRLPQLPQDVLAERPYAIITKTESEILVYFCKADCAYMDSGDVLGELLASRGVGDDGKYLLYRYNPSANDYEYVEETIGWIQIKEKSGEHVQSVVWTNTDIFVSDIDTQEITDEIYLKGTQSYSEEETASITLKTLCDLGDAIREVSGDSTLRKPFEMIAKVKTLIGGSSGGITPTGTIEITENGTHDVTNYASANVNVASSGGGDLDALIDGSITEVVSNATVIRAYGLYYSNLTKGYFPNVIHIRDKGMSNCEKVTELFLPNCTTIFSGGLQACRKLTKLILPSVSITSKNSFNYCDSLAILDFHKDVIIESGSFGNNSALKALILRFEDTSILSGASEFSFSPIASGTGYIYVPRALVDSYKTATNWTTYASQFRALEDYTVDGTITGELDESKI